MKTVAAPERHLAAPSAHLVTCLSCKGIVSPVLARLASVACRSCRSIQGV